MCPCVAVAGLGGDSGKTLVSLGLAAAWTHLGRTVAAFKKGPDYIDAAWLTLASGSPCRNLDTFLMTGDKIRDTWNRYSNNADISLIEGNRGLFDGMDSRGSHSTAELAKLVHCPVVLVLDVTKMTRTSAAIVLGVKTLDPDVQLAGVVLNRVGGKRHKRVVTESIEEFAGVPVLGAIPKIKDHQLIPGRHLGLVTAEEHPRAKQAIESARQIIEENVDLERLGTIISEYCIHQPVSHSSGEVEENLVTGKNTPIKIAVIRDSAFPFYYPENLESLEHRGAELVEISALSTTELPNDIDALYIGGGFPETHARELSLNTSLHGSIRSAVENGLPVYAECGGLMYMCRSIEFQGETFPMTGVLPIEIEWAEKPAGHGYTIGEIDNETLFYPHGIEIRGHEFHHSKIKSINTITIPTSIKLSRGKGVGKPGCLAADTYRDGFVYKNVMALYTHIHAAGLPEWADGMLNAARKFRQQRQR